MKPYKLQAVQELLPQNYEKNIVIQQVDGTEFFDVYFTDEACFTWSQLSSFLRISLRAESDRFCHALHNGMIGFWTKHYHQCRNANVITRYVP